MKQVHCILAALVGLCVVGAAAAQDVRIPCPPMPSIVVTGNGEVRARPDLAVIHLGASIQEKDAATAQQAVNQISAEVIAAIRQAGIPERDIQTASLSLQPLYANQKGDSMSRGPRVVGYRASNIVQVRVEDLDKVGAVIDAGVAAGANEVQSLSFELKDDQQARAEALSKAVNDATAKAKVISGAMNVPLTGVLEVVESSIAQPPIPLMGGMRTMAMEASTPIQPGQVTVQATVTIRWRIADSAALTPTTQPR